MKKLLALLLTVCVCVSFVGCSPKVEYFPENEKIPMPTEWKFVSKDNTSTGSGSVVSYRYELGKDGEKVAELINEYLKQLEANNVVPESTSLESVGINYYTLYIDGEMSAMMFFNIEDGVYQGGIILGLS